MRILLVVLLGMGASLGLVRAFTFFADASADTILERVTEARENLPAIIAEEADLVMAFGSSMTEAGFGARQFDRELRERGVEVRSFNFGFGGLNPYFQDYLSRRIRDEFQARDRRLRLALIEFTPLQNTQARWQGAQPVVDSYVAMLGDGGDVWEILGEDLTRGIRVAEIKYLRDEVSAEMVTWYFGREMFGGSSRRSSDIPADEEKQKLIEEIGPKLTEAFNADYPDYDGCDWCWDWQGAGTIPEERSQETRDLLAEYYRALRSEKRLADNRLWRIDCCDIEELRFEETLVSAFIRTVSNFLEFADQVEVVLLPRNHEWIGRPPEASARLREVLERIRRETGVTIRSFEDAEEITPEMYSDTTHLSRYAGDVAFTSLLVRTYAEKLAHGKRIPASQSP